MILRAGLLVAAIAGLVLGPAAFALAVPPAQLADDPRCTPFRAELNLGLATSSDVTSTDEGATIDTGIPRGLVTSATCAFSVPSAGGQVYALVFFDDPRGQFVEAVTALGATWRYSIDYPVDAATPADLVALPATEGASVGFSRGSIASRTLEQFEVIWHPTGDALFFTGAAVPDPYTTVYYNPPPSVVGIDDPSSLSNLRGIVEAAPNPLQTVVAVTSAGVMTLAVGVPGVLLGGVMLARQDALVRRIAPLAAVARRLSGLAARRWVVWAALLLAGVIATFVDPNAGINPLTGRLLLTFIAAFILFNLGGFLIVKRVVRRFEPEAKPALEFRFGALLLVALTVLVSRLAGLDPGIVVGMVSGVVFATSLVLTRQVLVIMVGTGAAVAVAMVAWVGYSVLTGIVGDTDAVGVIVAQEMLAALTIQGVSTLPIALLPFARLDGGVVFQWQKVGWGFFYTLGMTIFVIVMFTIPGGGQAPGDFWRWLVIYLVFAAVAVGIWAVDRALVRRTAERAGSPAA